LRKTTLYAPRIKGDLDLGLEPTRIITTALGTTEKDRARIDMPGGRLPGQSSQGIYEESITAKYVVGTKREQDDRTFRYSRATEALIRNMGALNSAAWPINAATLTGALTGATSMSIVDAACAAGDYAGGFIVIFTAPMQMRRIIGNDASDGTEAIIYLDGALEDDVAIGTWTTGYTNIYAALQAPPAAAPDYVTFIGVPLINATLNHYLWLQTSGPCYGVADGTVPGSTANHRDVYFATSGNIEPYGDGAAGIGGQYAGYLLPVTAFGAGDQFFMLDLKP